MDARQIEQVAGSAEMRTVFYSLLEKLGKTPLFPEAFHTQQLFAESDMVQWLVFPTELERAPDEIELMKVVTVETGAPDGIYDYYLFRFRTNEPHWAAEDGWMAGVSGPFRRKDQPTIESLGDTFSSFVRWGEKSPDEHVGEIHELIRRCREREAKDRDTQTKEHDAKKENE